MAKPDKSKTTETRETMEELMPPVRRYGGSGVSKTPSGHTLFGPPERGTNMPSRQIPMSHRYQPPEEVSPYTGHDDEEGQE